MVAAVQASVRAGAVERAAEGVMDWVEGGPGGFRRLPRSAQEELLANAATAGPTYGVPAPRVTCAQLRLLRLPVLVLRGEHTRRWYRLVAEAAATCVPGAEAAIVPDAGHMMIVENPSATAGPILSFIERH
jgi:pimeloyl-ACP methyl ester carboxylesterase